MDNNLNVSFRQVDFGEGFWKNRYELNKEVSVNCVRDSFEKTGRFDALRFNFLKNGKRPHFFYDSDVAKWIEAVGYIAEKDGESMAENERLIDEIANCMEAAQREDGYLNSTVQQICPEQKFKDRSNHELYCAGHLIEAAIAYHRATGKEKLLQIMERYCDCIYKAFVEEKTAAFVTPGHEEIELALMKLYAYTKNKKYFDLAKFFLENRGKHKEQLICGSAYYVQDEADIRHLTEANGHAVRALYLYCGMADYAAEIKDEELLKTLNGLFDDIVLRKLYISGGVGSTFRYEGFTVAYDLSNSTAYSESCCAIGLILFAMRMRRMIRDAKYGHLTERVLYNALLTSESLDGKRFFYENPLEISLEEKDREIASLPENREHMALTERVESFGCSCCPPNLNRFFAQLGDVIAFYDKDGLAVEQYISSKISSKLGEIIIEEEYATKGTVIIRSEDYMANAIYLRIPEWCNEIKAEMNGIKTEVKSVDGYIKFKTDKKFLIKLDFCIQPKFMAANPLVSANVGKVALTYGPLVYCLEGVDNGERLRRISVDIKETITVSTEKSFHGFYTLETVGYIDKSDSRLYFDANESLEERKRLKFIPYFAHANRGESDMLIWIRKRL